jgi:hypothetical protein
MREKVLVGCLVLIGTFIVSVGYQQAYKVKAKPRCQVIRYIMPDEKFEDKQSKVVMSYAKLIYNNGKIR